MLFSTMVLLMAGGGESRKSRTLISLIIAIMRQVKMGQMNDLHNELIHAISIRSFEKYEMQNVSWGKEL